MITFNQLMEFVDTKKMAFAMAKEMPKESMVYGILCVDDEAGWPKGPRLKNLLVNDAYRQIKHYHPTIGNGSLRLDKISIDIPGEAYLVWFDIPENKRKEVTNVYKKNGEGDPWISASKKLYTDLPKL